MNGKPKDRDRKSVEENRRQIEKLDEKLLELLRKRLEAAAGLVENAPESDAGVFDPGEEEKILRRMVPPGGEPLTPQAARAIFREILSAARAVQAPLTVAYLGPESSVSHQAAITHFGHGTTYRPAESIEEAFELVENDECRQGVVPIENAFEGSIKNTLDLLRDHPLRITSEILVRVRYSFLTNAKDLAGVRKLYAHPITAAQCTAWVKNHLPGVPIAEVASSAMAAAAAAGDPDGAALGSALAAQTYGLGILEANIEDRPDNVTRFISIGKTTPGPTGDDKTSIMFSTSHRPGALFEVLKILAKKNINMTRIESRPLKTRSWQYLFFVDMVGHAEDSQLSAALKKLQSSCEYYKWLGSYPVGASPWG